MSASVLVDCREARLRRLRKSVLTSARLLQARPAGAVRWVPVMVTLTYGPESAWAPGQIRAFVCAVREWGKRAGYDLPVVWVMELHKSGRPHYHVLIYVPRRLRLPRADSRGWWRYGMTNTIRARNGYGYLAKYASKGGAGDGAVPKGARLFGVSGLTEAERRVVAWWKLPQRLRTGAEGSVYYRPMPGGGRVEASSGVQVLAEWRVAGCWSGFVKLQPDGLTTEQRQWRQSYAAEQAARRVGRVRRPRGKVDLRKVAECDSYLRYLGAMAFLERLTGADRAERLIMLERLLRSVGADFDDS